MQGKLLVGIGLSLVILSALLSYLFLLKGDDLSQDVESVSQDTGESQSSSQSASGLPSSQSIVQYSENGFTPDTVSLVLEGVESGMVDIQNTPLLHLFPQVLEGPVSDASPIELDYYDTGIVLEIVEKGKYVFTNSYNLNHQLIVQVE